MISLSSRSRRTFSSLVFLAVAFLGATSTVRAGWNDPATGSSENLKSVDFPTASIGYAAGQNGTILKSIDGGASWVSQTSGTAELLWNLDFLDASTGYVAGRAGTLLKTTDGGANWNPLNPGTSANLIDVFFADASNGWIVAVGGVIRNTTDAGANWNAQTSGTTADLRSVAFVDSSTGWAVGFSGTILKTVDGGSNWNSQTVPDPTQDFQGLSVLSATTAYVVGSAGTILKTTDGGTNWIAQTSGTIANLWDCYFTNATIGYATGSNPTVILKTVDGGTTWISQDPQTTERLRAIYFTDALTGWATGDAGTILNTTDGGAGSCLVSVTTDSGSGSLRACVIYANGSPGADTITVPSGTYNLSIPGTGEDDAATGDLDVKESLTLNGAGAGSTIIDGNAIDRVFDVRLAGTIVAMSNLTIRDGNAAGDDGGGIRNSRDLTLNDVTMTNNTGRLGGAIFSTTASASLTLNNVILDSNTATSQGGALTMSGGSSFTLTDVTMNGNGASSTGGAVRLDNATGTMTGVTVTGNSAFDGGGFSLNNPSTNLTLTDVTISGNTVNRNGGGVISRDATVTANGVTVDGNNCTTSAADGGGFRFQNTATANLNNVTISNNTCLQGGGIAVTGTANVTLTNVTLSGNGASAAGGGLFHNGGTLTIVNTIVANSSSGGDCSGTIVDGGNNLDTDGTCGVGLTAPPLLGTLQDNGGPTSTHALLAGSPAIDTSNVGCLPTDQRGIARPINGVCDIGAYEADAVGTSIISGTVYHDANANSALDIGELGIGTAWVKLVQGGSVLQVVPADLDTGAYTLINVADGSYDVIVDDNNNGADSTPTAPVNWIFENPAAGLLSVVVAGADLTGRDFGLTFNFDLSADCSCGYEDGAFTQVGITIDGDMSDWGAVFSDGDNNACDATDDSDLDHPVQSTGRNLLRTAVTWDATYFSMWTQRTGSSDNTQNFIYYADTDVDGILQNGEPVVVAKWQGNTGNVTLELYTYDDLGSGGDPMLDAGGFADGYSMPGDLTSVKTLTMPDGSGQGSTTGSTDGTQMEWKIEWTELGVAAGSAIGWHTGSTNSNPGAAGLGAQVDDNLGGCGGQCTGSNQFPGVGGAPIDFVPGETVYVSHLFTNTGNGNDLFDFTWSWTGDFAPASVTFYEDLGTVGEFDAGVDLLLADTDGDPDPDTGIMTAGASFNLLVAITTPGPPVSGSTTVTTIATSNFVPGCGGTVTPERATVDNVVQVAYSISGTVFEDVNYGGGIGRDRATASADAPSFTIERGNVTVELYDAASGNFLGSAVTAVADGTYSFTSLPVAVYTVRVVNDTVTSSRPGSDGSELAVQLYRIDGDGEPLGAGANKVGGERPSNEDAAANSGAQTLAALQGTDLDTDGVPEWTQSIVEVDLSGGDVTGVDFGFNFNVVVNSNDAGQGSLRQFILNSNLLN